MRLSWHWVLVRGVMALVFALILGGVHLGSWALASRGLRVTWTTCDWMYGDTYTATVQVRNTEDVAKVVSLRVQGRFRPGRDQAWPNREARFRYSAVSQSMTLPLPALGEHTQEVVFAVPGTERFSCSARAFVNGQHRRQDRRTSMHNHRTPSHA
jgi:hypothetical protein